MKRDEIKAVEQPKSINLVEKGRDVDQGSDDSTW